jgi:hypothetical protein
MLAFWVVMHSGLLPWRQRKYVYWKRWYVTTSSHDVITQKPNIEDLNHVAVSESSVYNM